MTTHEPSAAEARLAAAIRTALNGRSTGEDFVLPPESEVCTSLERYVPEVLRRTHREWMGESFDGVLVGRATKVTDRTLRLVGTGILVTDQSVTALRAVLEVDPTTDYIAAFEVRVGEPGGGSLGISGPPCSSGAASRLLSRLPWRDDLDTVAWVYSAAEGPDPG